MTRPAELQLSLELLLLVRLRRLFPAPVPPELDPFRVLHRAEDQLSLRHLTGRLELKVRLSAAAEGFEASQSLIAACRQPKDARWDTRQLTTQPWRRESRSLPSSPRSVADPPRTRGSDAWSRRTRGNPPSSGRERALVRLGREADGERLEHAGPRSGTLRAGTRRARRLRPDSGPAGGGSFESHRQLHA